MEETAYVIDVHSENLDVVLRETGQVGVDSPHADEMSNTKRVHRHRRHHCPPRCAERLLFTKHHANG